MYKSIFINGNEFQKNIYKQYSIKLTKVKFLSKQMYYREKLSHFNHDQQKIWNLIKFLLPSKSKTKSTVTKIKISNSVIDDPSTIVREYNDYFCVIRKALARQLPDHQCNFFIKYMKRPSASSMVLDSPQVTEIINIIRSLSSSKSCGFDNIPTFFLNLAADILAHPLVLLFEPCFALGIFPDKLKIAKIIPILKKGDCYCNSTVNNQVGNRNPAFRADLVRKRSTKLKNCNLVSVDLHFLLLAINFLVW